jgi:hypothetical protein
MSPPITSHDRIQSALRRSEREPAKKLREHRIA